MLALIAVSALASSLTTTAPVSATTCPAGMSPVDELDNVCEQRFEVNGTFIVPNGAYQIEVLIVGAGGGGGGGGPSSGGGGGAAGSRVIANPAAVSGVEYGIQIGAGGSGGASSGDGGNGAETVVTFGPGSMDPTSAAMWSMEPGLGGKAGTGSGGGNGGDLLQVSLTRGLGGAGGSGATGGGGGGASYYAENGNPGSSTNGGDGAVSLALTSELFPDSIDAEGYGGGGGAGDGGTPGNGVPPPPPGFAGSGAGKGGAPGSVGVLGFAGLGSGGGGGGSRAAGGEGGSGIVVIRIRFTPPNNSQAEFTYFLPDGRECTSISPQRVQVGTMVELPGVTALCQTMTGSTIVGWTIPVPTGFTGYGSPSEPFPPGLRVRVVESQRFTAVVREPILTFVYDANVATADSCISNSVIHAGSDDRHARVWVPRSDIAQARFPVIAACTPPGHRLSGWTDRVSGVTFEAGAALPSDWADEKANRRTLYATWQAAG